MLLLLAAILAIPASLQAAPNDEEEASREPRKPAPQEPSPEMREYERLHRELEIERLKRMKTEGPELGQTSPKDLPPELIEKIKATRKKLEQQELETLRKANPGLEKRREAALERRERIQGILASWRKKELTDEQAEAKLSPLVRQDVQPEIDQVPDRIRFLEDELESLRRVQKDPGLLVRRRVARLMGKPAPK